MQILQQGRESIGTTNYINKLDNLTRGKEILRHSAATIYKIIRLIIGTRIENSRLVAYFVIIGQYYLNRYYLRCGINIRIVSSRLSRYRTYNLIRGKEILRHSAATIYKVIRLIIGARIKNSRVVACFIRKGKYYLTRYYLRYSINIRIVYSYFLIDN